MLRSLIISSTLIALTACAGSPEDRAERRNNLISAVFPNPSDREGVILAFPIGDIGRVLEMSFIEAEVSEAEIASRVSRYCAAQSGLSGDVSIREDRGSKEVTLPDGRTVQLRNIVYNCAFDS